MVNPQNNNIQVVLQGNNQGGESIQQQVPAGAHTTLAFKVLQTKVPEFFRQKAKDTISALNFIRHIDDLARTNNWNNTVTYNNLANALGGFTCK